MSPQIAATVGHGSTAMWYLTRSTGLVSLVLLSATVFLGIVSSVGWTTERWPRFLSQAVHRNLSLLCLSLIAVHVVTTVADGYVPIGYLDAVVPFHTPYRPLWVGLGALAFDLLIAVGITSGLRRRIGVRAWRGVHWLAYLCWPIAVLHGLGSGSDTRLSVALAVEVICVVAVVGAAAWRLLTGRARSVWWRVGAGAAGCVALLGIAIFALAGPLQPGWSRRAGTSAKVLAQLSSSTSTTAPAGVSQGSSGTSAPGPTPTSTPTASGSGIPPTPFSANVSGSYQTSTPTSAGQVEVVLTMQVAGRSSSPLVVRLDGTAVNGGVAMSSSRVTWGEDTGTVTALNGSTIEAAVSGGAGSMDLAMDLVLDRSSGSVTGTVSGSSGAGSTAQSSGAGGRK